MGDKGEIITKEQPGVVDYLRTLRRMLEDDIDGMIAAITSLVRNSPDGAAPRLGQWSYTELRGFLSKKAESPATQLMARIADFLEGKIPTQEIKAQFLHNEVTTTANS